MRDREAMKREELYETIAAEYELDGVLMDQTLLVSDLGFDSLGMFDLVLFVEEFAGVQSEQPTMD
jgi:acyl carrier protein